MRYIGYTKPTHVAYAQYKCPVCGKVVINEDEYDRYTNEEV